MAKPEWAIVNVKDRENLVVLETFVKRADCDKRIAKMREGLSKEEKYDIAELPLDKKGNPLMPP
jgi:hypothetical protein